MNQTHLELGHTNNTTARDIACGEQPQQRMESFGAAALSDTELVALILQTGLATREVLDVSSRLIAEAGGTLRLLRKFGAFWRRNSPF